MNVGLADTELADCIESTELVQGPDGIMYNKITGAPHSYEMTYRSRNNPLPKCALNYDDAACSDNVIPILPHNNLSQFGQDYVKFMCSQGKCPPSSYEYRDELFATKKKTMEHPTLYKGEGAFGVPRPYSIFDSFAGFTEGFSGNVEAFMGCDVYGSSFVTIMTLLVAFLMYRIYISN